MIPELADFDAPTATGILARAALAVEDDGNPAANPRVAGEPSIRAAIFAEVRRRIAVHQDDWSAETIARIGEAIDKEIDAVSPPVDPEAVLDQLGKRGELPSDLYRVVVAPSMQKLYEKHRWQEMEKILETVRAPDRDESLGLTPVGGGEPALVKLFSKHYSASNPFNDYTELVVGQPRPDRQLVVTAAWRLYTFSVPHSPGATLFELLKNFCAVYGTRFKLNGVDHEPLNLSLEVPGPQLQFNIEVGPHFGKDRRGRRIEKPLGSQTIVWFTQSEGRATPDENSHAYLVMVIDTAKYMATLTQHGW